MFLIERDVDRAVEIVMSYHTIKLLHYRRKSAWTDTELFPTAFACEFNVGSSPKPVVMLIFSC